MSRANTQIRARVQVSHESDAVVARRFAREMAVKQGLSETKAEALATAVTEIARNIVVHAGSGQMTFGAIEDAWRRGVVVIARDTGPGIRDIEQAMEDGFSTKGSLGFGLPGARRLVDEFEIESTVGMGTVVMLTKWSSTPGDPS